MGNVGVFLARIVITGSIFCMARGGGPSSSLESSLISSQLCDLFDSVAFLMGENISEDLFGSRPVRSDDITPVLDRFCAVPEGGGAVDGRVRSKSSNLFDKEE
jgi:hypothetical protein